MLVLSGCDYVEKTKVVDELTKQQEEQKARIDQLEKQLEQQDKKQAPLKNKILA